MSNQLKYTIQTVTSNQHTAGTDANVFIELFGNKGNSGYFF
jgi:hypothetical protein